MEFAITARSRADDSYYISAWGQTMLATYGWVILGAIFGAVSRFFFTHLSSEISKHHGFPYGTLFVNVTGSLLAGFVLAYTTSNGSNDRWRLLLVVGFCGAYTTFSGYAFETMAYLREARYGLMLLNVAANNISCFVSVIGGIFIANAVSRR